MTVSDPTEVSVVEHWYDFTCPFCYVAQDRNAVLRWAGVPVSQLPFAAHPDIGPNGRIAPARGGPTYKLLAEEARRAGLDLVWPARISPSRPALIRAEIVRRIDPARHAEFCRVVFDAYFGHGHDIGRSDVLVECAVAASVEGSAFSDAALLSAGSLDVDRCRQRAHQLGVRATPTWRIAGRLLEGLRSHRDFQQIARELSAAGDG